MQSLESLYNGITGEEVELTFKYLSTIPLKEEEDTDNTKQVAASSPQGISRKDDESRRAEAEIKRESLGRSRGSGKGYVASLDTAFSFEGRDENQRRGFPHSNICALCDLYIHIFRHRCLVCGRVYCKNCVGTGMGEMIEGRKCIECLGRRFSQRYIERAGKSGCCFGYPSEVKKQELIWAEKGASRSNVEKYKKNLLEPNPRNPPIIPNTANCPTSASFSSNHGFPLEGK